ncbi:hypothetical protein, partial [Escherichia coli]|uniref:hypothetical protein n=1 Tax=Escherichia coli TaxID=562 RepID=UPI00192D02BB
QYAGAMVKLNELAQKLEKYKVELQQFLTGNYQHDLYKREMEQLLLDTAEEVAIVRQGEEETIEQTTNVISDDTIEEAAAAGGVNEETTAHLISKLRFTSKSISGIPGFKKISEELIEKADRLENRQFTVALFGAFSAGKSSFANALIG